MTDEEAKKIVREKTPIQLEVKLNDIWAEFLRELKITPTEKLVEKCIELYYKPRVGVGKVVYYPDSKPALIELKKRGLKLGIISNVSRGITFFLKELKFEEYFDIIVFSWEVGWRKPFKKIFEEATKRLRVKPEESIMVGDSLKADVTGAKNFGMIAIWINRRSSEIDLEKIPVKPDYTVKSLLEVVEIVDRLNYSK